MSKHKSRAFLSIASCAFASTFWIVFHSTAAEKRSQTAPASTENLVAETLPAIVAIRAQADDGVRSGSGFVVDPSGVVVTNLHILRGASSVAVKTHAGEVFDQVRIIGYDDSRDIVLLRIAGFGLPTLAFGNSDEVQPGAKVLAVGNPAGLEGTTTEGIVSGIRLLESGMKVIQTDAAASPGSSGSPLLNQRGEVIGIIAFKRVDGEGLNFAIPINYVRGLMTLDSQLSLEQLNKKLLNRADLFSDEGKAVIDGKWKELGTGRTIMLKASGDFIYGEIAPLDDSGLPLTLELRKQTDGTYTGKIRGIWTCWYMGFGPRRIDKSCQLEQDVVATKVEASRIEGRRLYRDVPPSNTLDFVKYCKTCGESVHPEWREVTLVRMD